MTHHSIQGIVGLIGLIYLCLTGLPFLTSRGVAEQQPDTTVSDLIDALKDQDPVIRQGVATALGGLGAKAATAVPALIETLKNDPYPNARQQDLSQILSGGVVSPIRGVIRRPKRRTVRLE
jgi:hypothetical protein